MADDTSILQEIDDALRADRVSQFWKLHGGEVMTFCAMLILATAASSFWKSHLHDVHERQTGELAQAERLSEAGKYDDAIVHYEKAEADGGGVGGLASIRHAQALVTLKQQDKAVAVLNDMAARKKGDAPESLRDYASLEAGILARNAGGRAPLAKNETFAHSTAELNALQAMQSGDTAAATAALNSIVNDNTAPFSQRMRAMDLMGYIQGNGK